MSRLARALNSSDLQHQEQDCDVDLLQAAGLTAIHRTLGVLIVEAKEGAAGEGSHSVARVKDLEEALTKRVKSWAMRWGIRVRSQPVAEMMVRELIIDCCSFCQGRGFVPMRYDGTRLVAVSTVSKEDKITKSDCPTCLGSGAARRQYHERAKAAGFSDYTRNLGEWWEAVLAKCCDAEIAARRYMWKRLK